MISSFSNIVCGSRTNNLKEPGYVDTSEAMTSLTTQLFICTCVLFHGTCTRSDTCSCRHWQVCNGVYSSWHQTTPAKLWVLSGAYSSIQRCWYIQLYNMQRSVLLLSPTCLVISYRKVFADNFYFLKTKGQLVARQGTVCVQGEGGGTLC